MIFMLSFLLIILYFYYQTVERRRNLPPGPTPWPIFGNLLQMDRKNPEKTLNRWGNEYGGVCTIFLPKLAVAMSTQVVPSFLFDIFTQGNFGLLLSDGDVWREHRRFTLQMLRHLGVGRNIMEVTIMLEVDQLVQQLNEFNSRGECFDPSNALSICVASVISRIMFGHPYESGDEPFLELRELLNENMKLYKHPLSQLLDMYPFLRYIPLFGHFNYDQFMEHETKIRNYLFGKIDHHKKNFDKNIDNYVDSFLKERQRRETAGEPTDSFSEWQVYCAIEDLTVAGIETTVATLLWGIIFILYHPDIQEKLHDEIDRETGKDTVLTMKDKNRLPYVSATINEIQRLANIVPIMIFHQTTEDTNLVGYNIPAGMTVIPQNNAVMHDSRLFPDPYEFKPERFLEEDGKTMKKVEPFIPFGIGKRQCIGESLAKMELFLIFTTLMQKFNFTIANEKPSLERVHSDLVVPKKYECCAEER